MKKLKVTMTALVLTLVMAFAPATAFAAEVQEDPFVMLREMLGIQRDIVLTPEAMELALYDFDYLVEKIIAVAPTQNILERRFGEDVPSFFNIYRELLVHNIPLPSLLSVFVPERWADTPTDPLYIATDYLFTLLMLATGDLGGLGHMSVQEEALIAQTFFAVAQVVHRGTHIDYDDVNARVAAGESLEDIMAVAEALVLANDTFARFRYDIYNTPSVLWFYGFEPSEFDFDIPLAEALGFMDPDNVTTAIIEEGHIAYFRIASFMNNIELDSQILFPFFEEIQDFGHLIIDLRGNAGGWADYFEKNVVSRLIDEPISFFGYEFFMAHESTAAIFEAPLGVKGGTLYGIFPATQIVQQNNMSDFDQDDLTLFDEVLLWHIEMHPDEDNTPFAGEIWLLIDSGSMSASDNAATLSIATGFATVVGEPSAGVTGVLYTYAAMPNTGILFRIDLGYTVDPFGRSIEEFGVIPQIANAPGLDALETVLAIIAGEPLPEEAVVIDTPPVLSPIPAPPPAAVAAAPAVATRTVNGVEFVPLRAAANIHGYAVVWDGANNAVLVTCTDGNTLVVAISSNGTFNDNGTVFVTVEYAAEIFG